MTLSHGAPKREMVGFMVGGSLVPGGESVTTLGPEQRARFTSTPACVSSGGLLASLENRNHKAYPT